MKIGLAQINTTVGDLEGNRSKIIDAYHSLCRSGAQIVVFPELAITGYPPRDLIFKSRFVRDNEASLKMIAEETGKTPALVGFVESNQSGQDRRLFNAAAWCVEGKVETMARKCLLPTYDVFDEDRYFRASADITIVEFMGQRIGITICEDIWKDALANAGRHYERNPVEMLSEAGIDLLINLSASPWNCGKSQFREELVKNAALRCRCPAVYCNSVGGNDELVFDGHSLSASAKGEVMAGLAGFAEDLKVVDTESAAPDLSPAFHQEEMQDVHDALVLGLRDYAHKSGFQRALVGLSGGIDSSITAVLAAEALGPENVIGISLPSAISSDHSKDDAFALAGNLGITCHSLPIAGVVSSAEKTLEEIFEGRKPDVTEENIQARSRALLLMAVSNKFGALLLSTGNKSELAVGYCTLYGDMCGGLAVISDLPKVKVYELARWINREREIIPSNCIKKPPSAELRPGQEDQDSLPPYNILDGILEMYVEDGKSSTEIIEAGFEDDTVRDIIRKVDLNEYKRKQAAPGLKISALAFGVGRRIPIVQRYVS